MDDKMFEIYIKQLADTLSEMKDNQKALITILHASMLQLKAMEIKLDEHVEYSKQQQQFIQTYMVSRTDDSMDWKFMAKWAMIIAVGAVSAGGGWKAINLVFGG